MIEVTKDEFFKVIGPMNVHPNPKPSHSAWEHVHTRELVGRTEPGYMCRDKNGQYTTDKHYWLADRHAPHTETKESEC